MIISYIVTTRGQNGIIGLSVAGRFWRSSRRRFSGPTCLPPRFSVCIMLLTVAAKYRTWALSVTGLCPQRGVICCKHIHTLIRFIAAVASLLFFSHFVRHSPATHSSWTGPHLTVFYCSTQCILYYFAVHCIFLKNYVRNWLSNHDELQIRVCILLLLILIKLNWLKW